MNKPLYLISDHLRHAAQCKAQGLDLKPDEWVYIPYERTMRERELRGRTVPHACYLVGAFGDKERAQLVDRP